ncbi:small monomeric GTPase [Entamoeba marina]
MAKASVVMLGGGSVGKSSITIQYCYKEFKEAYDPTLEDAYKTTLQIDDAVVDLNIIDTAGQEEYSCLRDNTMRDGDGFCLVYSITDSCSYKDALNLRPQIYRSLDLDVNNDYIPIILCGNKSDLEDQRAVETSTAQTIANEWGIPFIESSAKNNSNITELFTTIVTDILKHKKDKPTKKQQQQQPKKKKSGCLLL